MVSARAILLLLALPVSIGCEAGGPVSTAPPPGPIAQDLPSLVQAAPLIIVGKVVEIQPGRSAGEGDARLQFNDVRVSVERRLVGEPPAVVVVEQVDMARRIVIELGPAYKCSERYVLFLRPGEGQRYITVPQGRFLLKEGTVHPTEPGPVAEKVKGTDEAKFVGEIAAIAQGRR